MSTAAPALDPAAVQDAAGVPVLNPDTGDVHAIPTNQVDAARAAGGRPVAKMLDPTGTARWVSMDQVGDAQKAGGKLVPYGSQSSEQIAQGQTGITPAANPVSQAIQGVGRAALGLVTGPIQAAKAAFAPPANTEETAAEGAAGPVGLAADRMVVQPARAAFKTAGDFYNSGHPILAAGAALGALPIVGPMGQSLGQRAAAGDVPGAVAEGVTSALLPKVAERAAVDVQRVPGIKQVVQKVQAAQASNQPVPGENYTPNQHQAFSAVLARGTGMGKDFIAPDVAADIASPVRQAAADNPSLVKAIQSGQPKDALGASQAILQKAKETIDQQHQMALQPVASTPIDMRPVVDAVPAAKSFHDEAETNALQDLKDRASRVQTLGDLNDFRQYLGNERDFRQSTVAASRGSVADKALQSADNAARDHYYDQLEQATGLDFQGLKRTESGILKAKEAFENVAPGMVNKDVLAHEDQGALGTVANVADTATRAGHGLPFVGYVAEKLRGTPLEQVQSGMQKFLTGLPQPRTYRGPLTSQFGRPPLKLPANTPGNAPYGANPAPGGVGSVQPATVTPAPVQVRQLPAQAGPAGAGIPAGRNLTAPTTVIPPRGVIPLPARANQPLLGAGEGNPEFVTPPPSPPGPVNQPTAVTSVNAGTPRPLQEPIPQRTIQVSPEGQAAIQRPALPPPATHAFSQKAWQSTHPNGNLKTAIKQAQAKGYRIVE